MADGHRIVAAPLGVKSLDDPGPGLEPVRVVVPDEPVGRVEDRRARAVVAAQDHHPGLPVALAELEDVADRRAAELVDRLVVVADHGHVAVPLGDQGDELGLGAVRVLELVHEHVPEPPLDRLAGRRRLAQEPQRERDLVAEVDRPVGREQLLVAAVRPGQLRLPPRLLGQRGRRIAVRLRRLVPGGLDGRHRHGRLRRQPAGMRQIRVRRHVLVLRPREERRERVEEPRRVAERPVLLEPELEQALAQEHDGLRAREHPGVRRQPELERELADEPVAEGVERGDRRVRVAVRHQLVHPDLHLVRGLVREREREDLRRPGAPGRDQPGDAARDDLGLAGARAGHDQQRPVAVRDRPALLRVQAREQLLDAVRPVGSGLDGRLLDPRPGSGRAATARRGDGRRLIETQVVEGVGDRVGRDPGGRAGATPRRWRAPVPARVSRRRIRSGALRRPRSGGQREPERLRLLVRQRGLGLSRARSPCA